MKWVGVGDTEMALISSEALIWQWALRRHNISTINSINPFYTKLTTIKYVDNLCGYRYRWETLIVVTYSKQHEYQHADTRFSHFKKYKLTLKAMKKKVFFFFKMTSLLAPYNLTTITTIPWEEIVHNPASRLSHSIRNSTKIKENRKIPDILWYPPYTFENLW